MHRIQGIQVRAFLQADLSIICNSQWSWFHLYLEIYRKIYHQKNEKKYNKVTTEQLLELQEEGRLPFSECPKLAARNNYRAHTLIL